MSCKLLPESGYGIKLPTHTGEKPAMSAAKTCSLAKLKLPARRAPLYPLGAAMFSDQAWREIARSLRLSGQELQVVRGIFDDDTEAVIAGNLKVSPHTVHTYCERLYHKVGATGRVKLALRVMDEYIVLTLAPGTILPPLCANFATGRCPLRGTQKILRPESHPFQGVP